MLCAGNAKCMGTNGQSNGAAGPSRLTRSGPGRRAPGSGRPSRMRTCSRRLATARVRRSTLTASVSGSANARSSIVSAESSCFRARIRPSWLGIASSTAMLFSTFNDKVRAFCCFSRRDSHDLLAISEALAEEMNGTRSGCCASGVDAVAATTCGSDMAGNSTFDRDLSTTKSPARLPGVGGEGFRTGQAVALAMAARAVFQSSSVMPSNCWRVQPCAMSAAYKVPPGQPREPAAATPAMMESATRRSSLICWIVILILCLLTVPIIRNKRTKHKETI